MRAIHAAVAAGLVGAGAVSAQTTFRDTFEGNQNHGGWEFGETAGYIAPAGGNPGAYLHGEFFFSYLPFTETSEAATTGLFIGNYRERNVSRIAADVNNFIGPVTQWPFCLLLETDNGTPADPMDDWAAFTLGEAIPVPGTGWRTFSFDVPSQATTFPRGWQEFRYPPAPPTQDWNLLVTNVASVYFYWGDPTLLYIGYQEWKSGLDNISITFGGVCYPDCDETGTLTVGDFTCFQNRFLAGEPYADCDAGGTLTVADFVCFQNRFVAGCK